MPIAFMYNTPSTPQEMAQWSAIHQAQHVLTNNAVAAQKGITLPMYILDPINLRDPIQFLLQHQQMHNFVDAIYGIAGYDLTDINLSDPEQFAGWIFLNAQLHQAEAQATGAF